MHAHFDKCLVGALPGMQDNSTAQNTVLSKTTENAQSDSRRKRDQSMEEKKASCCAGEARMTVRNQEA